MRILIVVNSTKDLPFDFEGVELLTARKYITDPTYSEIKGAKVFNLCLSYRYQSLGYYVSLLASARGHKPFPDVTTIQDMKTQGIIRAASEEIEEIIQKSLASIQSKEFVLSIYFGHNLAKRHDHLSQHLFKLFPVPFLRAQFGCGKNGHWFLRSISPIAASDIPDEHRPFVLGVARKFFSRAVPRRRRSTYRYDLAMLYNPLEQEAPSNPPAIKKFIRAAQSFGMEVELIEKEDYARLAEFDALFIRETTSVNHHTYRFARRAFAESLVTVDDPESILKCTNKVFLAELLMKKRIPVPQTIIVHRENLSAVSSILGFPIILKKPDSSFSQGVVKVENDQELMATLKIMFERSEMIIAQKFMPTEYDWRVGIFDQKPLFVCKYFMAGGHWQVIKRDPLGKITGEGGFETLSVGEAPKTIVNTALRASNLIGDGLYGVDLKQVGKKVYVIEVNDNPNVDSGIEDKVLGFELYRRIMAVILERVEKKKRGL